MNNHVACIEVCNQLLRGEISAIETYQDAAGKCGTSPTRLGLEKVLQDHHSNASELRVHIHEMGGEAATSSGAWGAFAKAVESTARLLGDTVIINALAEGEQHGVRLYEDALENPDVMETMKATIRETLLPRTKAHVEFLAALNS